MNGQRQYDTFGNGNGNGNEIASPLRSHPGVMKPVNSPTLAQYILLPWLTTVFITLWALLTHTCGLFILLLPAILICLITGGICLGKYKQEVKSSVAHQPMNPYNSSWPEIYLLLLIIVASLVAGVVCVIIFCHFFSSFNSLGGGATYLNMLPSQSGMAHSDATSISFAPTTFVDTKRSHGFTDAMDSGEVYCVAPLANKWTELEPVIQFFAAGIGCCSDSGSFACGGGEATGATVIATEENAAAGYRSAVQAAAAAHHLEPATGYLLLNMVSDPMGARQDSWSGALKLTLIFIVVYFLISMPIGYMAYKGDLA
jgi:hypothetical protein